MGSKPVPREKEKITETEILQMSSKDIADVIVIGKENELNQWSPQMYLSEIENSHSITLSLKYRKRIAGFIIARLIMTNQSIPSVFDSEILAIAVAKHLQNTGLGQILFNEFLRILGKKNVSEIWLEVRQTNLTAIGFYKKNGFTQQYERKNYYTNPLENALVMKKTIGRRNKSGKPRKNRVT